MIDEKDGYLIGIRRGDGTWMEFTDRPLPLPAKHAFFWFWKGQTYTFTVFCNHLPSIDLNAEEPDLTAYTDVLD
ncbi:hypothetical protein ACP4OV_003154 [Aristida adscensionis]